MAYSGIIFEECKILGDRQILDGLGAAPLEDVEITRSQIFDCGLLWVQRLCWDGGGWHGLIVERVTLSYSSSHSILLLT